MLLCSVLLWDSNPSEPVPTQQRERGGKYPYSIKVVGKGRRHSQRKLLPSALEPFSVKYAIARSFFINSLQKKGDTPHPQEQ
jgi:hypothetical protein